MNYFNVYVVHNCSDNSHRDDNFWGENTGVKLAFSQQPQVGKEINISNVEARYRTVNIHRDVKPYKVFVEAI